MAANSRATRLMKAMDLLAKTTFFDHGVVSKVKLQPISNGSFQGTFTVDKSMCNVGGTLHGGFIASVIDVLSAYTLLSNTNGRLSVTTNMSVNFIRPALNGDKVNVVTKTVKSGHYSIMESYFYNEQEKILAKGTTSFLSVGDEHQGIVKELLDFDVYEE